MKKLCIIFIIFSLNSCYKISKTSSFINNDKTTIATIDEYQTNILTGNIKSIIILHDIDRINSKKIFVGEGGSSAKIYWLNNNNLYIEFCNPLKYEIVSKVLMKKNLHRKKVELFNIHVISSPGIIINKRIFC